VCSSDLKKATEVHLCGTELDWLIVRPGTLTDEPGTGLVTAGPAVIDAPVSRDNVAGFLAAAVARPLLSQQIVELTDGETAIAEAVAVLAGGGAEMATGRRLLSA
jgi:uncharacterized protein YbjT (DUF2867 family)